MCENTSDNELVTVTLSEKVPYDLQINSITLLVACTRFECDQLKAEGQAPEAYSIAVVKTVSDSHIELKSTPGALRLYKGLKIGTRYTSQVKLWIIPGPKIATFSQEYNALSTLEQLSKVGMQDRVSDLKLTFFDSMF